MFFTITMAAQKISLPLNKPIQNCVAPKTVAMTFDDGPSVAYTNRVITAAKNLSVPLTFFQIGSNVEKYPDVAKSVIANGFVVGDHTYLHKPASHISLQEELEDIKKGDASVTKVLGQRPVFFRPPFGDYTKESLNELNSKGFYTIKWSIDSQDSRSLEKNSDSNSAFQNVQSGLNADSQSGHIVLCHDIHSACVDAFPRIVDLFKSKGYRFVSMEECLGGVQPYKGKKNIKLANSTSSVAKQANNAPSAFRVDIYFVQMLSLLFV